MSVAETVLSAIWMAALDRGDDGQAELIEQALNETGNAPRPAAYVAGAALWYANRGMRVLPVKPGEKRPLGDVAPHGVKDATTDEHQLADWFGMRMHPQRPWNIAVACGDPFDVLDIDNDTGATSFLGALGDGVWLTVRAVSETPRGLHIWVPAVAGAKNAAFASGMDYRGQGGYVVVPPSHINGTLYRWLLPPIR